MNYGLSDQVRSVALEKYVHPAIRAGRARFSVVVKDLMRELRARGFPDRNWPQVCTAIQAEKFLRANGLEIEGVDGPPSKQSNTVVVRYRVASSSTASGLRIEAAEEPKAGSSLENSSERSHRLTEGLRGLLKDELAAYGGGEVFLKWVRSEDEHAA